MILPVPVGQMQARGWTLLDALGDTLTETGLLEDYDLVFLDTPPALGYLTINGLAAAEVLLGSARDSCPIAVRNAISLMSGMAARSAQSMKSACWKGKFRR